MANENILTLKGVKVKHKVVDVDRSIANAEEGELFLSPVITGEVDENGKALGTVDPHTGRVIPPAYVMRVGTGATDGGTGWLHAPASDVFPWAKQANITDVSEFAKLQSKVNSLTGEGEGGGSIYDQLEAAKAEIWSTLDYIGEYTNPILSKIDYTPATEGAEGTEATNASVAVTYIDGNDFATAGALSDLKGSGTLASFPVLDDEGNATGETFVPYNNFIDLANAFSTFMYSTGNVEDVLETLKEINEYVGQHGDQFATLSGNVNALAEFVGKKAEGENLATGLCADIAANTAAISGINNDIISPFFGETAIEANDTDLAGLDARIDANTAICSKTAMFTKVAETESTPAYYTFDKFAGETGTGYTLIIDCNDVI